MGLSALKDKKVVIADDYQINVEILSMVVEGVGARVETAFDGKACVEIVRQQQVDMILMDKNMPVMDGLDASRAIRNLHCGKDVVIVGITGSDDSLEVDECIQAGMDLVCAKSEFNEQKLLEIGERYFGDNKIGKTDNALDLAQTTPDAAPSAITELVMDFPRALREFDNDRDLLCSLMKDFCTICREKIELMSKAFATADYRCIQTEAHGVRGGAAGLCAPQLSEAAGLLERACKQQAKSSVVESLLDKMTLCHKSFDAFVQVICSRPD